jgi:Raf kinase inhibitor-like YbhB/YbcL family protein
VTAYDPDAPTGSGWWHWVVWNIPASASSLPAGIGHGASLPEGATAGRTDAGASGYFGACPPKGDKPHRYQFKVHALKVEKLELPEDPMPALVGFTLNANSLGTASLTAKYSR